MADNHIRFSLASQFDGEGFNACTQAIKANTRELGVARAGLGLVSKAFEDMSPTAAKATSGVASFVDSFVKGGIIGGMISLAFKGINLAIEKFSESIKKAKEEAEKYAQILKDRLSDSVKNVSKNFEDVSAQAKNATKEINDALKAIQTGAADDLKFKVAELHAKTMDALYEATEESEKQTILAQEKHQAAEMKAAAAVEAAARAADAAKEKRVIAQDLTDAAERRLAEASDKLAEVEKASAEYTQKRNALQSNLEAVEEAYRQGRMSEVDVMKYRKQFALALNELDEKYKKDKELLMSAEDAQKKAAEDLAAAQKNEKEQLDAVFSANSELNTATEELAATRTQIAIEEKEASHKMIEELRKAADDRDDFERQAVQQSLDDAAKQREDEAAEQKKKAEQEEVKRKEEESKSRETIIEKIKDYTQTIRDNSVSLLNSEGSRSNKSGITSVNDYQRNRLAQEKTAQQKIADQNKEFGGYMKNFIRDWDKPMGQTTNDLTKKYGDAFNAMFTQMSDSEIFNLMKRQASDPMNGLSTAMKKFFGNDESLSDWIKRTRENLGLPGEEEDYTKKSYEELQAINDLFQDKLGLK